MNKRTWIFIAVMIGFIGGGLLYRHFAQDVDSRGATRLMRAIEENDTDKAIKLLSASDVNARDKSGQTALFYAAKHVTEPKVIYKLIVAGADPMAVDKSGDTPLVTAAKYNPSKEVVIALAKQSYRAVQQQENKNKALVNAARHNTAEIIKTLLIVQANPSALNSNGKSAAKFLEENEKLTEQEKADFRQVMLVLEILEAREQFAKSMKTAPAKEAKVVAEQTNKAVTKKEKPKEVSVVEKKTADVKTQTAFQEKPTEESKEPVPQEKQMVSEENM